MTATKAQLDFIAEIEEYVKEKFNGTTREEASQYIGKHIDEYKLKSSSNWMFENDYM